MEWVLQVVDEVDDLVGVLRLYALGLGAEVGLPLAGSVAAGALFAVAVRAAS